MAGTASFRAGAAALRIPPSAAELEEGVYLGGYGAYHARRATGVHDDPWCRALALEDAAGPFVIAAVDMVGVAGAVLGRLRRSVREASGLSEERLLIASTHSHSSPDAQGLWGGVPRSYLARLVSVCREVVRRALDSLADARLSVGAAAVPGLTVNRRGWPERDEEMVVVRAVRPDGAPIGTLVNFACHPTAITAENLLVSRDFVGYAVDALTAEFGGVALFVNGAQGDVNPASTGDFGAARRLGEAVAAAASHAAAHAQPVDGRLHLTSVPLLLPLQQERLPSWARPALALLSGPLRLSARAGGLKGLADLAARRRRTEAAQIVAGLSMALGHGLVSEGRHVFVPTRAGYLRLGEQAEGFAAPGEVLTRLALPLKSSLSAPNRLFLGLTYDSLGYFLPEDEWMTGRNNNYEESVSVGRQAGPLLATTLAGLRSHAA